VKELLAEIQNTPIFAGLTSEEFNLLEGPIVPIRAAAGDLFCRAGEPSDGALFLVDGIVVEEWPDGIVRHHEAGVLLEPGLLLSSRKHEHNFRAETDVRLLRLTRDEFEPLLAENRAVARAILDEAAHLLVIQVRDLNRAFNELVAQKQLGG
jgi:CRP-like cAMP-binding protein